MKTSRPLISAAKAHHIRVVERIVSITCRADASARESKKAADPRRKDFLVAGRAVSVGMFRSQNPMDHGPVSSSRYGHHRRHLGFFGGTADCGPKKPLRQ